ncbi:MAG: TlpA family protein disulfide reductase [Rickettsiales bacterium]
MKKFLFIVFLSLIASSAFNDSFAVNHVIKPMEIENNFSQDKVKIVTKLFDGNNYDISKIRKKTILIFWVKWCKICKMQLEILNNIQPQLIAKNIQTFGISVDNAQDYEEAKKISATLPFKNANYYDAKLISVKQPRAVPTTLLLDENQKIIKVYQGLIDEKQILEF